VDGQPATPYGKLRSQSRMQQDPACLLSASCMTFTMTKNILPSKLLANGMEEAMRYVGVLLLN